MWHGLSNEEVELNRKKYGTNSITNVKQKGFFKLLLESLGDPIIKILLIALAIKVVFLFQDSNYFETLGILIAIFLASFISTISEYGSEAAFRRLQEESSKISVKVLRNGKVMEIPIEEVVKNDVVVLQSGDRIPADGYLLKGELRVDESSLNGEAKEAKKYPPLNPNDLKNEHKLYRGSVVYNGDAYMLVTEVGDKTLYGALASELAESAPTSPLKLRLQGLAKFISRIGYCGAALVTISYLFSVIVIDNNFDPTLIMNTLTDFRVMADHLIYALTLSVTIIVVAVPEGLPMMITLVLSSNMKRMLKSNVLVRRLVGIETAGSINVLLTDKTGTLTKGKLEVSEIITADNIHYKNINMMKQNKKYYEEVYNCLYYNNESKFNALGEVIGGNSTDKSCLKFLIEDKNIKRRVIDKNPFDSKIKYSTATLDNNITYIKGAIEKLLPNINYYLNKNGEEKILLNGKDVTKEIRSKEVNEMVSQVSHIPKVRENMANFQRKIAEGKNVIMEGRDIGTNVFPNADVKIYLDATPEERAKRRMKQNEEKGIESNYEEILENIKFRDHNDKTSSVAPLKQAEDAIYIDSSNLSIEEVTEKIIEIINYHFGDASKKGKN